MPSLHAPPEDTGAGAERLGGENEGFGGFKGKEVLQGGYKGSIGYRYYCTGVQFWWRSK